MPTSRVNIVTPVSGATTPLGVDISIDYEYHQVSNGYLLVKCVHPFPGPEILLVKEVLASSPPADTGVITIPHTSGFNNVEIEARLSPTNSWGGYYANSSVDEITISSTPPVVIDLPAPEDSKKSYEWAFDLDSEIVVDKGKAAKKAKHEHDYDPNADKEVTGSVANAYKTGSLLAVVYGKKKFSLNLAHVVKTYTLDATTGKWSFSIPSAVLKGSNKPRRLVVAVFDAEGTYQGSASAALKKKA